MPHRPKIPETLTRGPFTIGQALAAGLTRRQLRGSTWRRIGRGWYVFAGLPRTLDLKLKLTAVLSSLPDGTVIAGRTAAHLYGIAPGDDGRPEVIPPPGCRVSRTATADVKHARLDPDDVGIWRGLPVTAPLRTCFDLSARLSLVDAVVLVDAALHARLVELEGLRRYVAGRIGAAGVRRVRRVLDLAEPATESPMETRLRMLLVEAGLPRPQAQVSVHDERGRFLGRLDLYYSGARLGIEYDGAIHHDSLAADNRRQNRLLSAGVSLLRYTARDFYDRPEAIVAQVRDALAKCPVPGIGTLPGSK